MSIVAKSVILLATLVGIIQAQKRFVFRFDDIEDWYNSNVQIDMLNFFMDRGIAVSAGIIGNYVTGQDVPLYNALKRCVGLGPYKCALFNHGADASFTYSSATSVSDAYTRMKSCDDKIKSLFPGYEVDLFVPHQNAWNQYTLQAVKQLGYDAVSASVDTYSNLPYDTSKDPMQLSEQTTTAVYSSGAWVTYPIASTVADCNAAAAKGQVCVIMTHPHEFASGTYSLTMLQQLVDALSAAGFSSMNFRGIIEEARGLAKPTVKPTIAPTILTSLPTRTPTAAPSTKTDVPTRNPTAAPSAKTSAPTRDPTAAPSAKNNPPSRKPTVIRTVAPSRSNLPKFPKSFLFQFNTLINLLFSQHLKRGLSETDIGNQVINLLTYLMDHNIGVSVGVSSNSVNTDNTDYYNALKRCVSLGSSKCELYVQGSSSVSVQGNLGSVDDVKAQIQSADEKIKSLFDGYTPQVYVPSSGSWSNATLAAAKEVGFAVVASTDSSLGWDLSASPMQISPQTSTGVQDSTGTWSAKSTETIIADCTAASARGEACVIQMTANEFASGAYTTEKVSELVSGLQAAGFTDSMTFDTIISAVQGGSPTRAPSESPLDTSSTSKGGVMSYLSDPADYMIAVVVVVGLLLVAAVAYAVIMCNMRSKEEYNIVKSKSADLSSGSNEENFHFEPSTDDDEEKSLPSTVRRSVIIEPDVKSQFKSTVSISFSAEDYRSNNQPDRVGMAEV